MTKNFPLAMKNSMKIENISYIKLSYDGFTSLNILDKGDWDPSSIYVHIYIIIHVLTYVKNYNLRLSNGSEVAAGRYYFDMRFVFRPYFLCVLSMLCIWSNYIYKF